MNEGEALSGDVGAISCHPRKSAKVALNQLERLGPQRKPGRSLMRAAAIAGFGPTVD